MDALCHACGRYTRMLGMDGRGGWFTLCLTRNFRERQYAARDNTLPRAWPQ